MKTDPDLRAIKDGNFWKIFFSSRLQDKDDLHSFITTIFTFLVGLPIVIGSLYKHLFIIESFKEINLKIIVLSNIPDPLYFLIMTVLLNTFVNYFRIILNFISNKLSGETKFQEFKNEIREKIK